MSYLDSTISNTERAKAMLTVGTMQALLAAGVVAGLSITIVETAPDKGLGSEFIEDEEVVITLPPPPDNAVEPPINVPPPTPRDNFTFERDNPIETAPFDPNIASDEPVYTIPTGGIPTGTGLAPLVELPPPPAGFTPVAASPTNGPAGWITTEDYSRRDLTRGNEGTAGYRLVVGSNGKVDACEITSTSGHDSLDRMTCRLIQRRARFDPATNNTGAHIVGTFSGSVTWQIPD